jgi:hypothetical protein
LKLSADCPDRDDRQFHLNIPELPSSHLSFRAPVGAKHLRTLSWRGAQNLSFDAGRPRLEVDLGPVGALAVAWNREPPTVPSSVHVKEAYLWDLQDLSARLLANVQFNVIGASSLSVDLPPDLEVTTVAARPQDARAAASPPPWLRDWTLSPHGQQRRLTLEFSAPITGVWQVTWECIPRSPFAPDFALRFPRAIAASAAPAACAYRTSGLETAMTDITGLSQISGDEFLDTHWSRTRLEVDPLAPTRAYLRRTSDLSAVIRLHADAPKLPIANTPRSESTRPPQNQTGVHDDPKLPKPQATRDRLPSGSAVRISAVDVIGAPAAEERQVYRLSAKVNASGPTNLTLTWSAAVEIAAVTFDSDVLMVSGEKTTWLTIPIDERHRHGTLDCVWLTDSMAAMERPSMPRLESGGRPIVPESTMRSLVIPPGRKLVAEPLAELVSTPSRTFSGAVRLPFDVALSDRSAKTWSIAGDFPEMAVAWETASPRSPGRMIRTASLFALIVLVLLIRKLVGYLPLPEIFASVALAGWIATGAWLWFVPLAFALVMRATTVISSWRFGPQSAA